MCAEVEDDNNGKDAAKRKKYVIVDDDYDDDDDDDYDEYVYGIKRSVKTNMSQTAEKADKMQI